MYTHLISQHSPRFELPLILSLSPITMHMRNSGNTWWTPVHSGPIPHSIHVDITVLEHCHSLFLSVLAKNTGNFHDLLYIHLFLLSGQFIFPFLWLLLVVISFLPAVYSTASLQLPSHLVKDLLLTTSLPMQMPPCIMNVHCLLRQPIPFFN